MERSAEQVAVSIMNRFEHLGESSVYESGPSAYVVRHAVLHPIGFEVSPSPDPGVIPEGVEVWSTIAVDFPVTNELLGWVVAAQSSPEVRWLRFRVISSTAGVSPSSVFNICFSAHLPDVDSWTWSQSLGSLSYHSIRLREGFTDRFGGRVP